MQNQECLDSACRDIPCGEVSASGECDGDVARACLFGTLVEEDCAERVEICGFDEDLGRRACVPCTICDGKCVEFSTDAAHCGGCNQTCDGVCVESFCRERRVSDGGISPEGDAGVLLQPPPVCACVLTNRRTDWASLQLLLAFGFASAFLRRRVCTTTRLQGWD
ncbi:MAG: hypothetical protein GY822_21735 [Deltaproteobacteria bacterium]|nr:hypothetical protein [Deltaproteobacteria bacterium]